MNGKEIVSMVNLISNEKQIDKELIFKSLENSLSISMKKDLGKFNIEVNINRINGNMIIEKVQTVSEAEDFIEDINLKLSEAKLIDNMAVIGSVIRTEIPFDNFSRVNAQVFKQVIKQNFKQAERLTAKEHYEKLIGELFNVTVKKVMKDYAILVLNDETEGKILLSETNGLFLKQGARIRVVLENIEEEKNQELIFSRNSENYIHAILTQEIPAIYDENIEIIKIARIKGKRTKVVVKGLIAHIDTVRECVGPKAIRVKEVMQCLNGEAVEFINYDNELGNYINNIMNPLNVIRVFFDENHSKYYFSISDSDFVKYEKIISVYENLASQILSQKVIVKRETDFEQAIDEDVEESIKYLMLKLNIDEEFSNILVEYGFDTIEAIAYSEEQELLEIEGFDLELAQEIQKIANNILNAYKLSSLYKLKNITIQVIDKLNDNNIVTIEQLADLSTYELLDIVKMEVVVAEKVIMEARSYI